MKDDDDDDDVKRVLMSHINATVPWEILFLIMTHSLLLICRASVTNGMVRHFCTPNSFRNENIQYLNRDTARTLIQLNHIPIHSTELDVATDWEHGANIFF